MASHRRIVTRLFVVFAAIGLAIPLSAPVYAHCDGRDGPVVKAAREALARGGAPYTGLKPAGRDLGPAIPAADQALNSGNVAPLTSLLVEKMRTGLMDRYQKAMAAKSFNAQNVAAGREYIEAYVTYIHHVEGMYEAAVNPASGHYPEGPTTPHKDK